MRTGTDSVFDGTPQLLRYHRPMLVLGAVMTLLAWLGASWIGWRLAARPDPFAADPIVLSSLGWFVQALILLVVGCFGFVGAATATLLLFAPLLGALADRERFLPWMTQAWAPYLALLRGGGRVLGALLLAALAWMVLQLTIEPFFFDTLLYGYGLPVHWLAEGRIHTASPDVFSYLAVPSRMHALWGLSFGCESMVGFDLLLSGSAAALLCGRVLRDRLGLDARRALVGSLIVLSAPSLWELLLLRKDDAHALLAAAVLLECFLRFRSESTPSLRGALLLGWATGLMVAVKQPHGVPLAAATWLLAFGACRERGSRAWLGRASVSAVLALAVVVPALLFAWADAGHPLAGARPDLADRVIESSRWQRAFADARPFWQEGRADLGTDFVAALRSFVDPDRRHFAGDFGWLLILGAPLSVLLARRRDLALLWLAGFAGWYFTLRLPRFAGVLLPLSAVLLADLLARVRRDRLVHALIGLALVVSLVGWLAHPVVRSALVDYGPLPGESGERFVLYPPSQELIDLANRDLPRESSRLIFIGESRQYPCHVPFDWWNPHFRHPFERVVAGEAPETTWDRIVRERGLTHAIVVPREVARLFETSPAMKKRFADWLRDRTEIVAERGEPRRKAYLLAF